MHSRLICHRDIKPEHVSALAEKWERSGKRNNGCRVKNVRALGVVVCSCSFFLLYTCMVFSVPFFDQYTKIPKLQDVASACLESSRKKDIEFYTLGTCRVL